MATCDIPLERVQALLKVDCANGSLYNHMVRVVRLLTAEKPSDALVQIEKLSRNLKDAAFIGAKALEAAKPSLTELAAQEQQKRCAEQSLKLFRPSDPTVAPKVLGMVQNYFEDSSMFEWAGIGFGKQESYQLGMSLRQLAAETPGLESLRLWGKVFGIEGDYYVAEGSLEMPPGATTAVPPLPGTPEARVDPRGEGANTFIYWVKSGGFAPWVRLPIARADHIVASREIKRVLTGKLESPVSATPWFPGTEQHLLRSQIARITSSCTLAPAGFYEVMDPEETGSKNKLKVIEDALANFPGYEALATQAGWVHASPFLLSTGKGNWPDVDKFPEGALTEDQTAEIAQQAENEPEKAMLESIEADLEELKPEELEGSVAWSIKVYGDEGVYAANDAPQTHRVTAVRSNIWPGAITVVQGARFANLYVGYATKCGSLVPVQKDSGLPLRGTMPLMPLAPDDVMDEPKDLEEHEEPNPIQEEAESDKGDVDEEEEA